VVLFSGTNQTTGFDTGAHEGAIEVTHIEKGNLSFFAVTFPDDCETRIVSNRKADFIHREKSSSKVCCFNGAER
jgi:hypothetical protein